MEKSGEFRAFVLDKVDDRVVGSIRTLDEADLPDGDVVVEVAHSTLNYKDGLILKGLGESGQGLSACSGNRFCGNRRVLIVQPIPDW